MYFIVSFWLAYSTVNSAGYDGESGDWAVAGVALLIVNGVLPTAVLAGAIRRKPWAEIGHWLVGYALVAWIAVQVAHLGWPPHWLQILYFCYGWAIVVLAARAGAGSHASARES